jgi:ABC-2 type transport system permease protein
MIKTLNKQRLFAYMRKETIQVLRDPSSIMIAVVLPLMFMFIFGYGVSLDANRIKLGLVLEDMSETAQSLAYAFMNTPYFDVTVHQSRKNLQDDMVASKLRGVIIIPQDFSKKYEAGIPSPIQVIADGSETNTAEFVQNYANGVLANWLIQQAQEHNKNLSVPIIAESRIWFNPELKSRDVLLPGSIAITLSLIGILLTALVVAREWERGTMESIMATPIQISEMLLGKLTPYFLLGISSMIICVLIATLLFEVPFRGSFIILLIATAVFLITALSQGLLISTLTRSQLVSNQLAVMLGFIPAMILSGFLFQIQSMPYWIQALTYVFPPRYFVTILQSSFLAGNVWGIILPNLAALCLLAVIFLGLGIRITKKRLD